MRQNTTNSDKTKPTIQAKIEGIQRLGRVTRREHLELTSALLGGQFMTEHDRHQINQILEAIQAGNLKLVGD